MVTWPRYTEFASSLPSKSNNFLPEINDILNLPMIFGFNCFGELMDFLDIRLKLSSADYHSDFMPELPEETVETLKNQLFLSPKVYFEQKYIFERKIQNNEFGSFLDHLKFYNATGLKILSKLFQLFCSLEFARQLIQ